MRKVCWAVIVATVAACGGGGTGASPNDTVSPKVRDQLAVDAAALQPADVPGQFTPEEATDRSASTRDQIAQAADECLVADEEGTTAVGIRELLSGQELGHIIVRGRVESHGDANTLKSSLEPLTDARVKECVKQFAVKLFASDTIGDVTMTASSVSGLAEQRGWVLTIPVTSPDLQFTIGAEIVFARVGRYRSIATVITFDRPPDHALVTGALTKTVSRLPAE